MSAPTVSVVIPTYNRAGLLPRAVESVIAQTFSDWELIVVDDGSTDETPDLAREFSQRLGDRWVYLRQARRGCSAARNRGIDAARGEFVAFLDSDDEFAPTKLARQMELFDRRPELGFSYSDFSFIDLQGVHHASAFAEKFPAAKRVPHDEIAPGLCDCGDGLFDVLVGGYFIATIVGMVRRSVLSDVRFAEDLCYAEEWLFFLKVAQRTRAGFVEEPLSIHHYTAGSLARTNNRANLAGYRALLRRILAEFELSSRQRRTVRANLAQTARQLGYAALVDRDPRAAARHFASALFLRPGLRTLGETAQAVACLLRPGIVSHPRISPAR